MGFCDVIALKHLENIRVGDKWLQILDFTSPLCPLNLKKKPQHVFRGKPFFDTMILCIGFL